MRDFESEFSPPSKIIKGGIDSMFIAAIVDRVLPPHIPVDLINVAFENPRLMKAGATKFK